MSELITDAMVEAAAIALRNQVRERVGFSSLDRLPWSPASDEARADARAALEAVIPQIAKEVWYDGFEAGATWVQYIPPDIPHDPPLNPYD